MLRQLKEEFSKIISKQYKLEEEKIMQSFSFPREDLGDLATNISFLIATHMNKVHGAHLPKVNREDRKNPKEVAEEIRKLLEKNRWVNEIRVMGPYVNIFLKDEFYSEALKKIEKEKEKYGKGKKRKNKIMVEYFHANTHKGVHIGHIRNISIGECLCRLLEFEGSKVIRANYQGDIGPHVAKCLWGFINLHNQKAPEKHRGVWLGKVYSEASNKIKDDKELEKEVLDINTKLYGGDEELLKILDKTRKWCLDDFEEFYKEFDVKFDEFYFESQVEKLGKERSLELLKRGIAKKDQGAVIMDLKEDGLGVYVLLTKEGYPLYYAKELGLVKLQFQKYNPDKLIHVVGKEQELYFKQLFKTFEKAGMEKEAKASHHLIYELVMLPEGKMSSREGTMVLYEDLKNKLLEKTEEEVKKRHKDWKEKEVKETAKKIALAAIKFSMLKREANKQLIFDWDQALNLEGDSGPYLQYAYVRTRGILRKAKSKPKIDKKYEFTKEEKNLIKKLCELPEVVEKSSQSLITHNMPDYLLDIASYFNRFYSTSPVLREQGIKKETRLAIVKCSGEIIKSGLRLMGIEIVEKM